MQWEEVSHCICILQQGAYILSQTVAVYVAVLAFECSGGLNGLFIRIQVVSLAAEDYI
jgi:hypothetical protein